MPLVRVTPENAVDTVREQLETFAESVASAGRAPSMLKMAEDVADLQKLASSGCLEVEFIGIGGLHPAWSGVIANWLAVEPTHFETIEQEVTAIDLHPDLSGVAHVVRIRSQLETPPRRAGARVPPVLLIGSGSAEDPSKDTLSKLLELIRQRPLTLLLAPKGAAWTKALSALGSREDFVCKPRELEQIAASETTLADSLERPPWKVAGQLAANWSIASALESLYQAFAVALEKETRAARAKKASVEQRAQQLQGTAMPTEVLGEVRGVVQKKFDRFQKGVSRQLKELVAPQEGTLWREVDAATAKLDQFDMVKKPKVDVVTIPPGFQQPIVDHIEEVLGGVCRASVISLNDFLRDIKEEIERLLEERGGPPIVIHFQHLPAERVETVLSRSLVIQRPYRGEISRKGVMDMFMAARRYQMLFFMIFSAFGLSFIRQFTAFTVPAGLMLMAYGFLSVYLSFKQQRVEAEEKEMTKARETLQNELSRAMSEVQKVWDQTLSSFMTEQQQTALEAVETAVRSGSALESRRAAGDKELVQQQIKSLDATQRKLADGIKAAETAEQDLKQIRGSLIEFFVAATSPPAPPSAATPGAAGSGKLSGAATPGRTPVAPPAGGSSNMPDAAQLKAETQKKLAALKAGASASAGSAKPGAGRSSASPLKKPSVASKAKAASRPTPRVPSTKGARGESKSSSKQGRNLASSPSAQSARKPVAGAGDPSKKAKERLEALKRKVAAKKPKPPDRKDDGE